MYNLLLEISATEVLLGCSCIWLDIRTQKFPTNLIVHIGICSVRKYYEFKLKIIGQYFKATRDRGLVINPLP